MRIIDSTWEKRNLGLDVKEIVCSKSDSPEMLSEVLSDISVPYSVIKIPVGCSGLLIKAQEMGYYLIEMTIPLEGDLRRCRIPGIYQKFMPGVKMVKADDSLISKVLLEIRRGEIYETDRIAVDPYFSKEIAGERYYNWCRDALEDGAIMDVAYYKDVPVAYNITSIKDNGVFDGLLGGVFSEARHKGLGFLVVYLLIERLRQDNGRKALGRVSSNNPPILRLHMLFGFEIKEMQYVLIKHQ